MAGIVGLDLLDPASSFVDYGERLHQPEHPLRAERFDFVVGLQPDKRGLYQREDQLAIWFPSAKVLLVYAGRHAFGAQLPEPGQAPDVSADAIDPPGLAAFFQKALHPVPEQSFPSASAMHDALIRALGRDLPEAEEASTEKVDPSSTLRSTGLARSAVKALAKVQIHTVGEFLGLSEVQLRAIDQIGKKTAATILAFRSALEASGLRPRRASRGRWRRPPRPCRPARQRLARPARRRARGQEDREQSQGRASRHHRGRRPQHRDARSPEDLLPPTLAWPAGSRPVTIHG